METTANLVDLPQEQLSGIISSIKKKLKDLGLEKLSVTFYKQLIFTVQIIKQGTFVVEGSVPSSLRPKVDELSAELEKLLGAYGPESFAVEVESGIGEGEKFPPLENVTFLPTKEAKKFECAPGEVVLVDFWATWCGPCQKPMQHNQEMLEKNGETWNGKARIVGISVDDKIEAVEKRVEERKWEKVEHYHAPGGFNAPAAAQFGINGIPCVFLVDKKGTIRFRGHPSSVNLETKINELIVERDDAVAPAPAKEEESTPTCSIHGCSHPHPKEAASSLSIDAETEHIKKFQERHEANKHLVEKIANFTTGIVGTRAFKPDGETFTGKTIMAGKITSQDKEAVVSYWKNVFEPLPKDFAFDNRVGIDDAREVKYGSSCGACKKALEKGVPQYVCTTCQFDDKEDHAFCIDCADKEMTQEIKSGKDLFHPHGLLLLHEDSEAALKSLKRIMNRTLIIPDNHPQFAEVLAEKGCGGVSCDSCGESPVLNYRWACANCPDYDYCTACLRASRDPNNEKHKEVDEKGLSKGHDKSHVFYRAHYLMALQRGQPKPFEFPK